MRMCHFLDQNGPFVIDKCFCYKPSLLLSSTYWPFPLCKIFKNSYSGSRVMRMHHFWTQNGPCAPNKLFSFGKLLISFSSTYLPLPLGKILKKFFWRIQSCEDAQFLGPKWPISPNENFFQKTCSCTLFLLLMPIYKPKIKVRY